MTAHRQTAGVALVISLAFVVMLSVVVVCLLESMRTDRPAAGGYEERARAAQFAQSAVEQVVGTLQQLTADTNRNWISQPGQIVVGAPTDDPATAVDERKVLKFSVPLSSGSTGALPPGGSASNPFFTSPNLNVPTLRDPTTYLIAEVQANSTPTKLPVDWIYVKQDGTLSRTSQPDNASSPTTYQWIDNLNYASDTAPVVGRYAYWTDDESSKINYNIACDRDSNGPAANQPPCSPTKIDLTALPGMTNSMANGLYNYITNAGSTTKSYLFFNTPEDARRLNNAQPSTLGISQVLQSSKFEVTHYNHDPNTTFFNQPRIVLTTHPATAGWTQVSSAGKYPVGTWVGINGLSWADGGQPQYLHILQDPETGDPGLAYTSSIDPVKLNDMILRLALRPAATGVAAGYLQRTDWPMVNGNGSFQSKYYGSLPSTQSANGVSAQTARLAQLAVDIIDYVRAKESAQTVITPIIGYFNPSSSDQTTWFSYSGNANPQNGYIGLTRMPCINELGAWFGTATDSDATTPPGGMPIAKGDQYYLFKVEIYLPANYGLPSIDLSRFYLNIGGAAKMVTPTTPTNYHGQDVHQIYAGEIDIGTTTLMAGHYAVISRKVKTSYAATDPRPTTTGAGTRFLLEKAVESTNYQLAPANNGLASGLPIDDASVAQSDIKSLEVDDPRLNANPADWQPGTGHNTFGAQNSRWSVGKSAPATLPQVDTDNGVVSAASLYMPPPAGLKFVRADGTVDDNSPTGSNGMVSSVGELGYVHTGFEPCSKFVDASNNTITIPAGTPWRTVHLQPSSQDTTVVPDWALMDLFTAPVKPPTAYNSYVYAPHQNGFGGRVNLNSIPQPFTNISREIPLTAVLQNCTFDSTNMNSTISPAVAQGLADNIYKRITATGGKLYGYSSAYVSPGEVAEIKGIADGGEKSEELIRQIANLVTNRGNVFSVYSIGQSIKQAPNGTYTVTGEQRLQVMVERYLNYNTADATKNEVCFAPVYYRNLTP